MDPKFEISGIRLEPAENGLVLNFSKNYQHGTKSGSTWKEVTEVFQFDGKNNEAKKQEALKKLMNCYEAKLNNPCTDKQFKKYYNK